MNPPLGMEDWINAAWMSLFFVPAAALPGWLAAKGAGGLRRPRVAWSRALGVTLVWGMTPVMMEWSRPLAPRAWLLFWLEPLWAVPIAAPFFLAAVAAWILAWKRPGARPLAWALGLLALWWSWCVVVFGHLHIQ